VDAATVSAERRANLAADLILGRARIVVLAGIESGTEAERLADQLIDEALARGLSIARIDAGSGRPSTEPGITDLAAEAASFGDVVHKTAQDGLAEVPWGHLGVLDRRSGKPLTLVEALSDLYEVVMVVVGRAGPDSSLPMFAGLAARLVLVPPADADSLDVDTASVEAAALGYRQIEAIMAPPRPAEVA
jgi:hypothetical protein